jgi:hypothetical protein
MRRKMSRGDENVEDGDVEAFEQSRRVLPRIAEDDVP